MLSVGMTALALLARLPSTLASQPTEECPILGPLWPSSTYSITKSSAFAAAKENFPATIESLFDTGVLNRSTATFALDVYSTQTNESIYSYFHTAEGEDGEE